MCLALPLLLSCAVQTEMPVLDRASLGRVALQVTAETKFMFLSVDSREQGDGAATLAGAELTCAGLFAGAFALGPFAALGAVIPIAFCGIEGLTRPSQRAASVETGAAQRDVGQSTREITAEVPFARLVETETLAYARKVGVNLSVHLDGDATPADSLLEIAVPRVFVIANGRKLLQLAPYIEATVRVLRPLDRVVLDSFQMKFWGEPRMAEDMLRNDGLLLQEGIRRLVVEVAERAVDEVMLVVRDGSAEGTRGRKALVPDYALQPLQPHLQRNFHFSWKEAFNPDEKAEAEVNFGLLDRVVVADLRPEFAWETHPRAPVFPRGATVSYDFRVFTQPARFGSQFRASTNRPVSMDTPGVKTPIEIGYSPDFFLPNGVAPVYERFGLSEPRHRLEEPLEPCQTYRWTVRARWMSGSVTNATEWMGAWNDGASDPRLQRRDDDNVDSPLVFYAPFVTPSADGRGCQDH